MGREMIQTSRILAVFLAILVFVPQALAEGGRDKLGDTLRPGALKIGQQERHYHYFAPQEKSSHPLVLVLHGGGGNGENAAAMTGFTAKAMQEGFIVVYPDGSGRLGDRLLTWNAGHCCGYALEQKIGEAAFFSALIDKFILDHGADPKRVYITGLSNGAMMAHRLGIVL